MSEYYEGDSYGDGYGDAEQIQADFTDGSSVTLVDIDGDGYADAVVYDDGGAYTEYDGSGDAGYDGGEEPYHAEATDGDGYDDSYGYGYHPAEGGYEGSYEAGYSDGGSFYANDNLGTAVSTNPGGDEGYIALGDGEFVSWG